MILGGRPDRGLSVIPSIPRSLKRLTQRETESSFTPNKAATCSWGMPIVNALIAMRRRFVRWIGAAFAAVSNSSKVQFSLLGILRCRDMPREKHKSIKKSRSFRDYSRELLYLRVPWLGRANSRDPRGPGRRRVDARPGTGRGVKTSNSVASGPDSYRFVANSSLLQSLGQDNIRI